MNNTLNTKSFALAFGVITGLWMFAIAFIAMATGWGSELVRLYGSLFAGYGATLGGAIAGLVWGFVYGGVFGWLIAWLYNRFIG